MMKGAIFDMDGLLLDTERFFWESGEHTVKEFGQTPDPGFLPALGGSSWSEMPGIIHRFFPEVDAEAFRDACTSGAMKLTTERDLEVKPGVQNILSFLRNRGVRIAVASSSAIEIIEANLHRAGLREYFDVVASGTEVAQGKPAPDVFILAAERLELTPKECYVFEDSINGVRAGMAAGCVTVMVPDMVQPPEGFFVHRICITLDEAKDCIEAGTL